MGKLIIEPLQESMEKYFSAYRSNNCKSIFYCLGRSISEVHPGKVVIAEVGINYNSTHLEALARGIGQDGTKLIGIDPNSKYIPGIDYLEGTGQDLPLLPMEVDLIIFYDMLRFMGVDLNTVNKEVFSLIRYSEMANPAEELQKLCSELERVGPYYIIFSDPVFHFRMQRMSGRRHDYELIRSMLKSYIDIEFQQRYVKRLYYTLPPHEWLLLVKNV